MNEDDEAVHYWPNLDPAKSSPCGVDIQHTGGTWGSPDWSQVTCKACRLEMPMSAGRFNPVEYSVPEHIKAMDRKLGEQDVKRARLQAVLAEAKAAREKAHTEMTAWATILGEALTLEKSVEDRLAALNATETAEKASGVLPATPYSWRGEAPWRP